MEKILDYLEKAVEDGASDLFVVAGSPVCEKKDKRLVRMDAQMLLPDDTRRLIGELYEIAKRSMDRFEEHGDDDFSCAVRGLARFRINT